MTPERYDWHCERLAMTLVGLPRDRQATLLAEGLCREMDARADISRDQARGLVMTTMIRVLGADHRDREHEGSAVMTSTCPNVDKIAFTLLVMPRVRQARLLIDALNHAFAGRPDLTADDIIPWTQNLLNEIRDRIVELEQSEGHG
jgi:hypothetical protein